MHRKISAGLCITITVITLLITAVVTTAVTMAAYSTLIADLPEREAMYSTLSEIDGIVRNRELELSPLTFQDIDTIKKLFKKRLMAIYHTRISYPKENKETTEKNEEQQSSVK